MEGFSFDMSHFVELLFAGIASILASSGFWLYIAKLRDRESGSRKLLVGLAHDRIMYLCMKYIRRGWITQDEHENLHTFLYGPYRDIGGNGTAKRLIDEVDKLPIRTPTIEEIKKGESDVTQQ